MPTDRSLWAGVDEFKPAPTINSTPKLKGSQFLDTTQKVLGDAWQGARTVQNWKDPGDVLAAGTARTIEGGLKGIGAVASIPGIRHVLEAADIPVQYASKKGGQYLESQGIDPRFASIAANAADLAIGGGLAKGASKIARKGARRLGQYGDAFYGLASATGMGTGAHGGLNIGNKGKKFLSIVDKTTQKGVVGGRAARRIQGNIQLKNPPSKRAPTVKPNLPQEVIDEYTKESADRLRKGAKNRKDVPYLVDADDRVYRLDQKGWEYDGDIKQKKYALIDVDLKRARNAKLDKIRQQKVNLNTKPGIDQRDFYVDPDVSARHKKGIEEPHHRSSLDAESKLRKGLSKRENRILDGYFGRRGIEGGNSRFNRDNLPKPVHKALHSWQTRFKKATGADVTELNLTQRKKYIDQFVEDLKLSDVKTYRLMQQHLKKQGMKIKKTKPTQFPDKIQRHIDRSQEIGITEPVWKDGSIDYTWRPQSGTGQIDIPPQSMKTFKGLRDEFFDQIENLPSGSVWELNPKFKDAKRRRIYAKLFEGDERITRNADETLGWVLKVP